MRMVCIMQTVTEAFIFPEAKLSYAVNLVLKENYSMNSFCIRSYRDGTRMIGMVLGGICCIILFSQVRNRYLYGVAVLALFLAAYLAHFYKNYSFTPDGITVYFQNCWPKGGRYQEGAAKSSLYQHYAMAHLYTDFGIWQARNYYERMHLMPLYNAKFAIRRINKADLQKVEYYPTKHHSILLLQLCGCATWTEQYLWQYRLHNRGKLLVLYVNDDDVPSYLRMLDDYMNAENVDYQKNA